MPLDGRKPWDVLFIGGLSCVGKSTAAKEIMRRFRMPRLQVDDLRLALHQMQGQFTNDDQTACERRSPWRFAAVVLLEPAALDASDALGRLADACLGLSGADPLYGTENVVCQASIGEV